MKLWIASMLKGQKKHISFHTPGHKRAGADITELSYSDNLYSPHGVLAAAERDVAEILGAERSFLLTDGSTAGVFSMLYALRLAGGKSVAVPAFSHPSVLHACEALGMSLVPVPQETAFGIPKQPSKDVLSGVKADALLLTSPDYYGFFAPLAEAKEICKEKNIPLLVDGAHGSHLHFTEAHAGKYAAMWVDGVHKSLPALTQGAVVSAKDKVWGERLEDGVKHFRTTSPSYPILASVEYAVKYPRNEEIERAAEQFKTQHRCVKNDDWSKLLLPLKDTDGAQRFLERKGVFPEFNDGNYLLFYLSPCTKEKELTTLSRLLEKLDYQAVDKDAPAGAIPIYTE